MCIYSMPTQGHSRPLDDATDMFAAPTLGVCYYPEHWPEEQWQSDAQNMVAAGLSWVRIAEFAWSRIEPSPGIFDWGWLDRAVDILGSAGLRIVMCTPTATPPKWLVDQMPDMVAIGPDGAPRKFGSRRHYSFAHEGYRRESARISRLVAARYGQHEAVGAWQTDNEYGCHDTAISYCASALAGFRQWLAQRYGTIGALNEAWGNVFWSMEYRSFDEVELPILTVTEANPASALDFFRYSSQAVAEFNLIQTDIIRANSPGRPVSHNFMGNFDQFDHRPVAKDLDIAAWDSYPLGMLQNMQLEARKDVDLHRDCMRTGDPDFQAFHHDLYRGMGRLWVMEQQPGPVNWARSNVIPADGAVRLWSWEAIAHGAEVVSYFRWRQAPFAQEQMHAGLRLRNDEPAIGHGEAKIVAAELAKIDVPPIEQAEIAIIHDYEADQMSKLDGQTADFHYLRLLLDLYRAVRQNGGNVDIIGPHDALNGYKLILAPSLMHISDDLAERLAASGARILAGPRSAAKTRDFQIPEKLAGSAIADLTGFIAERIDALPAGFPLAVEWQGQTGEISLWHERGTITGTGEGQSETGDPLLVSGNRGAYLTGWVDENLMRGIIGGEMQKAAIALHDMPDYLRVRRRGTLLIVTNYGPNAARIPDSLDGEFLVGSRDVIPAGVTIIRG